MVQGMPGLTKLKWFRCRPSCSCKPHAPEHGSGLDFYALQASRVCDPVHIGSPGGCCLFGVLGNQIRARKELGSSMRVWAWHPHQDVGTWDGNGRATLLCAGALLLLLWLCRSYRSCSFPFSGLACRPSATNACSSSGKPCRRTPNSAPRRGAHSRATKRSWLSSCWAPATGVGRAGSAWPCHAWPGCIAADFARRERERERVQNSTIQSGQ